MARIAVFTDIHHNDTNVAQRHCTSAIPALRAIFNQFAGPGQKPDGLYTLGDNIMAQRGGPAQESALADARRLDEIMECFSMSGVSNMHHIFGNHEDKNMNRETVHAVAARHGATFGSRRVDLDGVSLVLWSPWARIITQSGGAKPVTQAELDWLRATLDSAPNPAIVMTHLPLDGDLTDFTRSSLDGSPSPVFGKRVVNSKLCNTHYPNAAQARRIIADSGRVIACLAGHTHWNEANVVDGVSYITIPSFVENASGRPHGGWAMVEIDPAGESIVIDVRGASPIRHTLPHAPLKDPLARRFSRSFAPQQG